MLPILFFLPVAFLSPVYSEDLSRIRDFNLSHSISGVGTAYSIQSYLRAVGDSVIHFNEHPVIDHKKTILECAKDARDSANAHLELAEEHLLKLRDVKDWRSKDRLKVLITSAMGTALIQEPRVKFLSVALALLTDLVVNEGIEKAEVCYELYKAISCAAAFLDESNYYNRLSLDGKSREPNYIPEYSGFFYANVAIDCLTLADMFTASLEYKLYGSIISNHISDIRSLIMNDMISNRKFTKSYRFRINCLLENYDEIVADCSKRDRKYLLARIREELEWTLWNVEKAEQEWEIKRK